MNKHVHRIRQIAFVVGLCIICLCLYLAYQIVWKSTGSPFLLKQIEHLSTTRSENSALLQQVNQLTRDYQNDCDQLLTQFMNCLESNVNPDFQKAKDAIQDVTDELCGLGTCVSFSYKAAKDKIKGTNDFDEAYMGIVNQPIVQPCLHANAVATEMLQTLNQQLMERHTQYAVDLAFACGDNSYQVPTPDVLRLQECINTVADSARSLQQQKAISIIVGLTLETIFIRSTCTALVKLFAVPVAKITGSLSIGGICAVADGPIPVMDIVGGVITIGGLAWTAYDIYDVTCIMPETRKNELGTGIDETQIRLLEDSKSKAKELTNTYLDFGNMLHAELTKEIH